MQTTQLVPQVVSLLVASLIQVVDTQQPQLVIMVTIVIQVLRLAHHLTKSVNIQEIAAIIMRKA